MSNIPTASELEANRQNKLSADLEKEVKKFTLLIIDAMHEGKKKLPRQYLMPTKEAQKQLFTDFAAFGFTLSFSKIRVGGTISWS